MQIRTQALGWELHDDMIMDTVQKMPLKVRQSQSWQISSFQWKWEGEQVIAFFSGTKQLLSARKMFFLKRMSFFIGEENISEDKRILENRQISSKWMKMFTSCFFDVATADHRYKDIGCWELWSCFVEGMNRGISCAKEERKPMNCSRSLVCVTYQWRINSPIFCVCCAG